MIPHLTYFHGVLQVSFNGPVAAKLIEAEFLPAWPEAQAQADSSKAQWQQRQQQQQQQVGPALTAQHQQQLQVGPPPLAQHQQQLQVGPPPLAQHQQQQQTEPPPPVVNYFHQQQQQMQWGPAFQQLQQQIPPDSTQQLHHGEAHASAAADGLVDGLPEGISLQGGLDPLPPGSSIEDYQDWNRTVGEAVASGSVSKKVRRVQGKQRKIPASELHAINLTRPVETPFEERFFWELYDRFTVKGVTKWDLMAAVFSWRAKQLRARGNFHVSEKTANQLKQHMHKLVLANLRRTAVAGGGQQTGPSMNPPSINPIAAPTMNAPADSALPHEEQLFNSSSRQMQCHDDFTSVAARQPNNSASQLNYNVQPQHGPCVTVCPACLLAQCTCPGLWQYELASSRPGPEAEVAAAATFGATDRSGGAAAAAPAAAAAFGATARSGAAAAAEEEAEGKGSGRGNQQAIREATQGGQEWQPRRSREEEEMHLLLWRVQ